MLVLLLSACLIPPDAIDARVDADGDGFDAVAFGGLDCDDDDPGVYPGAEEVCEDVDRNCDGELGTADADGDGFPGCEECDDSDAAVNPSAQEVCDDDGVDEDCDGLVNDDDDSVDLSTGTAFYVDGDGDGEGSLSAATVYACALQPGLAIDNTDCDDTDPFIPMPHEWCRNGVDDNCGGAGPEIECGAPVGVESLRVYLNGAPGDMMGRGLAFIPDIDGDGLDDFAISAPGQNNETGIVYVFSGQHTGQLDPNLAFATLVGARDGDFAGMRLHTGDPDFDGETELLVSMAGATLPGGTGGWFVSELDLSPGEERELNYGLPHIHGHQEDTMPYFGGLNDVIMTPTTVVVGFVPAFGTNAKVAGYTHAITGEDFLGTADWVLTGSGGLYPSEGSLQYIDLDGDGVEDIVGAENRGVSVGIQYGPFTGSSQVAYDHALAVTGQTAFGRPSAVGDFDGDGAPELALTAVDDPSVMPNPGAVLRIIDHLGVAPATRWTFKGEADSKNGVARQGLKMADVDADGAEDVLWGQPEASVVWQIYSGLSAGTYNQNSLRAVSGHSFVEIDASDVRTDSFGTDIVVGGDVNGDGRPDVLFGDHRFDEPGPVSGQLWLMLGGRW